MTAQESPVEVGQIADLLSELSQVQTELLDLLKEKQQRMASQSPDELVSLVDVMPTVLQLAGVPLPDEGRHIHGRLLPGTPGAPPARDAIFAEYGAGGAAVTMDLDWVGVCEMMSGGN